MPGKLFLIRRRIRGHDPFCSILGEIKLRHFTLILLAVIAFLCFVTTWPSRTQTDADSNKGTIRVALRVAGYGYHDTAPDTSVRIKEITPETEEFFASLEDKELGHWVCEYSVKYREGENRVLPMERGGESYTWPESFREAMDKHEAFMKEANYGGVTPDTAASAPGTKLLQQVFFKKCQMAHKEKGFCRTMETGFALGASTIAILNAHDEAALKEGRWNNFTQRDTHHSLDPLHVNYQNVGARGVARYKAAHPDSVVDAFHMKETAVVGMAYFLQRKMCFDLIFIDSSHQFEQNIMELTVAAQLIPIGGVIVMDDLRMASMKSTKEWIDTNLKGYLQIIYQTISENNLLILKIGRDRRDWSFFEPFKTNFI